MKEAQFLKKHNTKWRKYEAQLDLGKVNPAELGHIFIELTDDLAYAQTHFPRSRTNFYLNQLATKAHQALYKNKKERSNRIQQFWLYELPLIYYQERKALLYALVIFALATLIGVISTAYDETFVRLILGDRYINMTLDNIEKGDPMAVYKSAHQVEMFLGITFNNVMVSFRVFAFGLFFGVGTAYILVANGIMLGAFQSFFYHQGLLVESMLVIWIHGTIEISSIIIAGASGLVLGNSILFPKTYSRLTSFRRGANKGLKMIVGLVPLFVVAGCLESFVTRLTEMPDFLKLLIILASAYGIIFYFWLYPKRLAKKFENNEQPQEI